MWTQMPQQQNMVYDEERVGFFTDSRGGNGFLTYSENDTVSAIRGRVTASGGTFQGGRVKSFIEKQRSSDYDTTTAAGAGVTVHVRGNDKYELWTLFINASGDVALGGSTFQHTN